MAVTNTKMKWTRRDARVNGEAAVDDYQYQPRLLVPASAAAGIPFFSLGGTLKPGDVASFDNDLYIRNKDNDSFWLVEADDTLLVT